MKVNKSDTSRTSVCNRSFVLKINATGDKCLPQCADNILILTKFSI